MWVWFLVGAAGVAAWWRPGGKSYQPVRRVSEARPGEETVDLYLIGLEAGANRIAIIKVIREYTTRGLRETKELVDRVPVLVTQNLSMSDGVRFQQALAAVGARASFQPPPVEAVADPLEAAVDVELTAVGIRPIQVIKLLRESTHLGLREAKALVDDAPALIRQHVPRAEAEALRSRFESIGATITFRS